MGSFSKSNTKNIIFQIFIVYSLLTFLIFIILNIGSVRLFNSLNLSMSIISNGGFLPANTLNQIVIQMLKELYNNSDIFRYDKRKYSTSEYYEH